MKAKNAISMNRTTVTVDGKKIDGTNVLERFCRDSSKTQAELEAMTGAVNKWHLFKAEGRKDEVAMKLDSIVSALKASIKAFAFKKRYEKDSIRLANVISNLEMRDDTYQDVHNSITELLASIEQAKNGAKKAEKVYTISTGFEQKVA